MSDPNDLAAFHDAAWQHLRQGVADDKSPARYPTFATVSADGLPEARTVALRSASQSEAKLEVHTDIATPKVQALRVHPKAAFHIWLPTANLQIRLTTSVEILTGDAVETEWAKVPPISRISYGTEPEPGTPIRDVFNYEKPPNSARFAVLQCWVDHIDLVELAERHRRAEFKRSDDWRGAWLAP